MLQKLPVMTPRKNDKMCFLNRSRLESKKLISEFGSERPHRHGLSASVTLCLYFDTSRSNLQRPDIPACFTAAVVCMMFHSAAMPRPLVIFHPLLRFLIQSCSTHLSFNVLLIKNAPKRSCEAVRSGGFIHWGYQTLTVALIVLVSLIQIFS